MSELRIQSCRRCGAGFFPDRLRCPRCGARSWTRIRAGEGEIQDQTELRRQPRAQEKRIRLGSVGLDAGPVVIARLGDRAETGNRVRLEMNPDGAVWARPRQPRQPDG